MKIRFHQLSVDEPELIQLIARWYLAEWHLPVAQTLERFQQVCDDPGQVQLLLFDGEQPVATGGIYHQVGLLDREPRLRIHRHWLALLYTRPDYRQKGYGAVLCRALQAAAADLGAMDLHLFTDTAADFYRKLGWARQELLQVGGRQLEIMQLTVSKTTPHVTEALL